MQKRDRYIRLPEVLEMTGLSRSTIYAWIAENEFPPAFRLGARSVRWSEAEVRDWLGSRPTAALHGMKSE